jgi:hypothetical protein
VWLRAVGMPPRLAEHVFVLVSWQCAMPALLWVSKLTEVAVMGVCVPQLGGNKGCSGCVNGALLVIPSK